MTCPHDRQASVHRQAYGQWAAPAQDESLLIWPEPAELLQTARRNASALADSSVSLGSVPLAEVRRAARAFLGLHSDVPLIATGHQTELQHPGVWIKQALIHAAAEACAGSALHVGVDTDAPKHLKLRWPGFQAPLTDDPRLNTASWTSLLDPPTPAHLELLLSLTRDAGARRGVSHLVQEFLEACRAFLVDQRDVIAPLHLPAMLASAQHVLDWNLGLRYTSVLLSGLLDSEPWSQFVCATCADAGRFAAAYNAALAEHRLVTAISDPERPMPDLAVSGRRIELPFWLDDLATGRRQRATVEVEGGRPELRSSRGSEAFVFSGQAEAASLLAWLRGHQLRLTPRALSLTLFMRLCVCDLFVHGIGGGHYDQVTDRLNPSYFSIEPPGFAVTTATLYHPWAAGRRPACLPRLEHEGHVLAHRVLGDGKRHWLECIAAAPSSRERRRVFEDMHAARRAAMATDPVFLDWRDRMQEAEVKQESEKALLDRELFYAVQPPERLAELNRRVRNAFSATGTPPPATR